MELNASSFEVRKYKAKAMRHPHEIGEMAFKAVKMYYEVVSDGTFYERENRRYVFKMGWECIYSPCRYDFCIATKAIIAHELKRNGWTLMRICDFIKLKHHTSVMHLIQKVYARKYDDRLNDAYNFFESMI